MNKELLRLENICSCRKQRRGLHGVRLNLFEGEIIGIAGVNHAGKTELAKGISGELPFLNGKMYLNETITSIRSIEDGRRQGIYYFSRHSSLISEFSVLENFLLGPNKNTGIIQLAVAEAQCTEMLELLRVPVNIHEKIEHLSLKEKLLVEMSRAVYYEAKIFILDDVLNQLSAIALDEFQEIFEMLCSLHIGIILIDNGIRYLRRYCLRLFIMREGRTVAISNMRDTDDNFVISMMLGYKADGHLENYLEEADTGKDVGLEFKSVYFNKILLDISFHVYQGEIAGILNINKNSGRAIRKLLELKGIPDSGVILFDGRDIISNLQDGTMDGKIMALSQQDSIFPNLSMEENIMLPALQKQSNAAGIVNQSEVKYIAHELMSEYLIPYIGLEFQEQVMMNDRILLRKISFCRMLSVNPQLVVLSNPTQSIDITAKELIYNDIRSLKNHNIIGVIISSDVKELLAVCDRIIVVNNGRAEVSILNEEKNRDLLLYVYGQYLKDM